MAKFRTSAPSVDRFGNEFEARFDKVEIVVGDEMVEDVDFGRVGFERFTCLFGDASVDVASGVDKAELIDRFALRAKDVGVRHKLEVVRARE